MTTDTPTKPETNDDAMTTPIDELSTSRVAYIRARLCSKLETETDEAERADIRTMIEQFDGVLSRRTGAE
jgi:hypothetical protein